MVKLKKLMTVLVLISCFTFIAAAMGQTDIVSNTQKNLEEISNEEKAVLEELFFLSQEIDEMNRKAEELSKESEFIAMEIKVMEADILKRQENYNIQLEILEKVLVSYQKNGMTSYLETLLSAQNLTDFLKRLNVIQELSRNTGEMLNSMEEEKAALITEREKLISNKTLLEKNRAELNNAITQKMKLKQDQEDYLNSLSEEKEHYRDQLNKLDQSWSEVKDLFSNIAIEFSRVFNESDLSIDDFNLEIAFLSVKGSISDNRMNGIIEKDKKLPKMIFDIRPEVIQIEIPDKHLLLSGTIAIESGSAIRFNVTDGTFYEMKLEKPSIEELFRDGYLVIDFKELIGDITLKQVNMKDGFIEFKVSPFF